MLLHCFCAACMPKTNWYCLHCGRYLAIVHVMKRPLSLKHVQRAISGVWVVSGILFMGELYKFRVIQWGEVNQCIPMWSDDISTNTLFTRYEMILKFVVAYAIPMGLMVVLYTLIVWCLWHRKAPGEFSDENQRRVKKQMKKVITMLMTIVLIFNICWLPVHANHLLIAFDFEAFERLPPFVYLLFFWLAHANSAINPCLYFIFNESFRDGLKNILRGIYGGEKRVRYRSSTMRSTISPTTPMRTYSSSSPHQRRRNNTDDNSSEKLIPPDSKQIKKDEKVAMGKIYLRNRKASLDEKQSSLYFEHSQDTKRRHSFCTKALINDTQI